MSCKPKLVALFEGEARGGLRLLEQTRDPGLVRQVREWFATERRLELEHLEREGDAPRLRAVSSEEEPDDEG